MKDVKVRDSREKVTETIYSLRSNRFRALPASLDLASFAEKLTNMNTRN